MLFTGSRFGGSSWATPLSPRCPTGDHRSDGRPPQPRGRGGLPRSLQGRRPRVPRDGAHALHTNPNALSLWLHSPGSLVRPTEAVRGHSPVRREEGWYTPLSSYKGPPCTIGGTFVRCEVFGRGRVLRLRKRGRATGPADQRPVLGYRPPWGRRPAGFPTWHVLQRWGHHDATFFKQLRRILGLAQICPDVSFSPV